MAQLTFILLWAVGFLWAFWGMYVLVMSIYRAHLSRRLHGLVLVLSLPFVAVAHEIRRARRAEKFKPYDEVVAKAIPGQAAEAEKQRQAIRDADAGLQTKLDACKSTAELRKLLEAKG